SDGLSYSVELCADSTGDTSRPYGAYFLFLRWRRMGAQGIEGHLESDFLAYGETRSGALTALGRTSLADVKGLPDQLIRERTGSPPRRRWWDAMRDDDTP